MYATTAILAAVSHKQATGSDKGQHIDLSLFDTQIAMLGYRAQDCLIDNEVRYKKLNQSDRAHSQQQKKSLITPMSTRLSSNSS